MRSKAALVACALALSGCYKATFIRDPQAIKGVEQDRWVNFWFWGLVNDENFDVHEFCPNGRIAQIQTGGNFGTGIVHLLTIGIYAPRKIWVTCAADAGSRGAQLELIGDSEGRLVAAVEHLGDSQLRGTVTEAADGKAWEVSFEEARR
jgi:hypothetical protein